MEPVKRTIISAARSFPLRTCRISIRQILILMPFSVSLFYPFLPQNQNCDLIIWRLTTLRPCSIQVLDNRGLMLLEKDVKGHCALR